MSIYETRLMTSWMPAIDQLFVQPERLSWLWLVLFGLVAVIVGEWLRARWRRRLLSLGHAVDASVRFDIRRWLASAVRVVVLLLIVLALADPQAGFTAIEVKSSRVQIVCLLDRSASMRARDELPSRLERGKQVVQDVVELAGGGAVALVTFAGDARINVPLTRDYLGLLDRLAEVDSYDNQATGTNLSAGIATAATCFAERIESSKVLIVITDGEVHGNEPTVPVDLLPPGTEVLILGLGDPRQPSPIPASGQASLAPDGEQFLLYEGKIAQTTANAEYLRRLARPLGGTFQTLHDASAGPAVSELLRRAASAAAGEADRALQRQAAPRFHWLLRIAVALLVLEAVVASSKRLRFAGIWRRRPSMAWLWTLSVAACVCASAGWADPPSTGGAASPTARVLAQWYNRGVAAYRAGDWDQAETWFRRVNERAESALRAKAQFNLASTHYAIVNRGGISQREAIERLQTAIGLLRRSMAEGNRDDDARANIETIYRRLLQIQKQQTGSEGDDDGRSGQRDAGRQPPPGDPPPGDPPPGDPPPGDPPPRDPPPRDPPPRDPPPGDSPPEGGRGDGGDGGDASSGQGRSRATASADAMTEPLTDQRAEDQLRRIRQRARQRRAARDDEPRGDAAPTSASPAGPPW